MALTILKKKMQDAAKNKLSAAQKRAEEAVSTVTKEKTNQATGSATNSGQSSSSGSSSSKNSQYTQGNYTIGSDYGKQQAKNMGIGDSWIATDGSTWVKENDGTITVYHNGTKSSNAWTPSDLGILGQQQMAAGLDSNYVQNTMNNRVNKALTTEGLEKYAYDDKYWQMWNYIQSQTGQENQQEAQDMFNQWVQEYEQNNPKKEYNGKYDARIDALLNEILNRDDFSYDAMDDPLYQQYRQMYQREGDRAMKETLAEAAAGAGGMNTYAITAAQQAYNYYNSQLNDKIPELYQLAYEMYLNDKESKVQDLGILQNMDATQYGRYRDTINDYYNDKSFAYGAYQDAVAQGNLQNSFDYNSMLDGRDFAYNDVWKNKEWDAYKDEIEYNRNQAEKEWGAYEDETAYNRNQYDQESAKDEVWRLIELGVTPSADLIARSGMSETDVTLAVAAVKAQQTKPGKSSSSGSSKSSSSNGYTGDDEGEDGSDTSWTKGFSDLGIPDTYGPELLVELSEAGAIYEENGELKWTNGWTANNYKAKLLVGETGLPVLFR